MSPTLCALLAATDNPGGPTLSDAGMARLVLVPSTSVKHLPVAGGLSSAGREASRRTDQVYVAAGFTTRDVSPRTRRSSAA
jgi:hypothetical protein